MSVARAHGSGIISTLYYERIATTTVQHAFRTLPSESMCHLAAHAGQQSYILLSVSVGQRASSIYVAESAGMLVICPPQGPPGPSQSAPPPPTAPTSLCPPHYWHRAAREIHRSR